MDTPHSVYTRRLQEIRARMVRGQSWDKRLGWLKVAIFVAGAAMAVAFLHTPARLVWLATPVAIFVALTVAHDRVLRALRERERVAQFCEQGLARVEDRWAGTGVGGERFLDDAHPYARDLDLFGKGSLYELLCTAQTSAGEETLAHWLMAAASPHEVRERQAAMEELRELFALRERLFVAGQHVRAGVHPEEIAAWGESPAILQSAALAAGLAALALAWFGTLGWWLGGGPWYPLVALSLVNLGVSRMALHGVEAAAEAAEHAAGDLQVLAEVLAVLEAQTFQSERLRGLRAALDVCEAGRREAGTREAGTREAGTREAGTREIAPSRALRKLRRLSEWIDNRENLFVRVISPVIFYTALCAMAAERWKRRFGPAIRGWLAAVGEFEALAALAGYAWERPADVLPEFVDAAPRFEAEDLKHPLLPAARAVGNDLAMGAELRLVLISGPNMAGKSTLLRAVGLNAVLAQAGAPVRARRLRMSRLTVGASICVLDSLAGGVSRFYAEIRRLKLLSDLAGRYRASEGLAGGAGEGGRGGEDSRPAPLLFLLDELLSGTNSHDRLEGTRFVVGALVRWGGIGLVTTHDLALTAIPEAMGGTGTNGVARNCHFEDRIEDGKLKFDYRLEPGVVRTSNALKLMQAVGLEME